MEIANCPSELMLNEKLKLKIEQMLNSVMSDATNADK
jgi:hypothetical protein